MTRVVWNQYNTIHKMFLMFLPAAKKSLWHLCRWVCREMGHGGWTRPIKQAFFLTRLWERVTTGSLSFEAKKAWAFPQNTLRLFHTNGVLKIWYIFFSFEKSLFLLEIFSKRTKRFWLAFYDNSKKKKLGFKSKCQKCFLRFSKSFEISSSSLNRFFSLYFLAWHILAFSFIFH